MFSAAGLFAIADKVPQFFRFEGLCNDGLFHGKGFGLATMAPNANSNDDTVHKTSAN